MSVIIPVYNCEEYIAETLDSVLGQTLPEDRLEIIAVDDGSTDGSRQVLYSYAALHRNVHVLSIPNSGSASAPRNAGLDVAHGQFVFFLDADDKLEDFALDSLLTVAEEHASDVVLCKLGAFGAAKRASALPSRAFKSTQYAVDYIDSKAYTTLGVLKLIRRSVIEEAKIRFPLGYRVGEDQPFMMQVYFNAANVSILADKVYYWARGRGDGTNVTSAGQQPDKHYLKITALSRVIAAGPETGIRRALLLERPIMGQAGLRSVFGKKFLDYFDNRERSNMVHELAGIMEPMWNADLRSMGPLESQVLMDLVVRRDVPSVETVSSLLRDNNPIPLYFDYDNGWFAYLPPVGEPVDKLQPRLESTFMSIAPVAGGIRIAGRTGVIGADTAPDDVRVIWKHRKSGEEVRSGVVIGRDVPTVSGATVEFESMTKLPLLAQSAEWDLFIEGQWGDTTVRERAGNKKSASIDTTTTIVGEPPKAAMLFTRFGNLSIDIGPVRKYPGAQHHIGYTVKGQFVLGRNLVMLVTGDVNASDDISIVAESAKPLLPKQISPVDKGCIAVVFPKAVQKIKAARLRIVHEQTEDFVEVPFTDPALAE